MNPAMNSNLRVDPPLKPLVIWDGDCGFCRFWVLRYHFYTQKRVEYSTYQESADRFPQVPRANFQAAVHLIETDGSVHSGADAVFRVLAYRRLWRWLPWAYEHFSLVRAISEFGYRRVATHRPFFSIWTKLFWGRPEP